MHRICLLFFMGFAFIGSITSPAVARIKPPSIEELVQSADVIVCAKIDSVNVTTPVLCLWIAVAIVVMAGLVFSILRKKLVPVVCCVAICFIAVIMLDIPQGIYRRVARLSVSSVLKGSLEPGQIEVYYDDGFICDCTSLNTGHEYLLFLKKAENGYAMSWYDWSQWEIENSCVQTIRRTWSEASPIPLAEFKETIRGIHEAKKREENPVGDTAENEMLGQG